MRSFTLAVLCLALGACATTPEEDPVQLKLKELDTRETRLERMAANQVELAQRLDEVQAAAPQLPATRAPRVRLPPTAAPHRPRWSRRYITRRSMP